MKVKTRCEESEEIESLSKSQTAIAKYWTQFCRDIVYHEVFCSEKCERESTIESLVRNACRGKFRYSENFFFIALFYYYYYYLQYRCTLTLQY